MKVQDIPSSQCWSFLGSRRLGRLGCALDNKPYVVPVSFAIQNPYFFAFTTKGRKAEYLKENPLVCLQFDEIASPQSWTSVIVEGRFEEIGGDAEQEHAHALLEEAAWWEPGYVQTTIKGNLRPAVPFHFRIFAEKISGRQGIPGA